MARSTNSVAIAGLFSGFGKAETRDDSCSLDGAPVTLSLLGIMSVRESMTPHSFSSRSDTSFARRAAALLAELLRLLLVWQCKSRVEERENDEENDVKSSYIELCNSRNTNIITSQVFESLHRHYIGTCAMCMYLTSAFSVQDT